MILNFQRLFPRNSRAFWPNSATSFDGIQPVRTRNGIIEIQMKLRLILGCVVLGMAITAVAQTSTKDLPSAPSAVKMPPPQSAPPPQTPPQTPAQQVPDAQQPQPATPQANTQNAPAAATQAPAQKPSDAAPPQDQDDQEQNKPLTTLVIPVNEVNVVFTVTDKHGRFIKDLKKDDFKVLDDNKPPAEIKNFSSETNLPLRVGLLIDSSNSIRDRFQVRAGSGHRVSEPDRSAQAGPGVCTGVRYDRGGHAGLHRQH